ncbi:MAG: hypothetical protein JWO31_890 [Phycisphaerales bacterium]|nr:hypothetical protein [Phycisphaerales bacterium]
MTSRNAAIAEALKAKLNELAADSPADFGGGFVAKRTYVPGVDLRDFKTLVVTVFARENEREFISRGHSRRDFVVDVGVQKRLTTAANPTAEDANPEIDALMGLAEAVADAVPAGWYAGATGAQLVRVQHDPTVEPAHLLQHRTFTNVVKFTFRLNA